MSGLRLRGTSITKRFGRIAALRGIDFDIGAGESVAILGANGAGKSTLLRILAGLSRVSDGAFEPIQSEDSPETPESNSPDILSRQELRERVGYVGHATLLYAELNARENLVFAASLAGVRPDPHRVDELLEGVGLLDVAQRRAGTFSRGMAQRLAIARAIVHNPSLLLLDEPFTGLDEVSAERLSVQLAAQTTNERSLVVVTHDPKRAVELANGALILDRGEIVARPGRSLGGAEFSSQSRFEVDSLRNQLAEIAHRAREVAA